MHTYIHTETGPEQSACGHTNISKKDLLRHTCSGRFTFKCSLRLMWLGVWDKSAVLALDVYAWPHTTDLDKTLQRNSLGLLRHCTSLLPSTNCTVVQRWGSHYIITLRNCPYCTSLKYLHCNICVATANCSIILHLKHIKRRDVTKNGHVSAS